jgi:hypothetical protein
MMDGLKVYVAGPMSSVGGNFNFPLFDMIAAKLRAMGCEVFSPADYAREIIGPLEIIQKLDKIAAKRTRERLLREEILWIIDHAQIIVMLPGWERSTGATAERAVALAYGKRVVELGTLVPGLAIDIDLAAE